MKENMLTGGVSPDVANPLLDAEITIPKHVELLVEDIFNLPSPHIMPSHMLVLKERILSAYASGISAASQHLLAKERIKKIFSSYQVTSDQKEDR